MLVETLMGDIRDRFCGSLTSKCESPREKTFAGLLVKDLNGDRFISVVKSIIPHGTMLPLQARLKVMTGRSYPRFLQSIEGQHKNQLKNSIVSFIESENKEKLEDWERDLIRRA